MNVEQLKVADLLADPANARKHDKKNLDAIKGSLKKFGQQKPIVVDAKGIVVAGNGTLAAAKALNWESIAVVRTELEGTDATAYALADNRTGELAAWDDDVLGKTLQSLREMNFDIGAIGFDALEEGDDEGIAGESSSEAYTKKIKAPIYEPKGDRPEPRSLVDRSKATKLREDIEKANLPADVQDFLLLAADRHNIFDYEQIAEFYAHADPVLQDLMERSALVIIDFDKAIENGFVKLSKKIAEAYKE